MQLGHTAATHDATASFRRFFTYPFDCATLQEAHAAVRATRVPENHCWFSPPIDAEHLFALRITAQCVQEHGWQSCTSSREAMDACIESGERRRFFLEAECRRWRRRHQACILDMHADCEQQLSTLLDCARCETCVERTHEPNPHR